MERARRWLLGGFGLCHGMAAAATLAPVATPEAARLDRIEVRAARTRGIAPFDLPASLDTIVPAPERSRPDASVSEALAGVPGLLARERQNLAQDTQLSIRGFGARATFGVRGLRLYVDGVPASMPDGQGQLAHIPLAAGDRIEILRGPFSALHGAAAGGVLHWWSADGGAPAEAWLRASAGRYDSRTTSVRLLGGGERHGYHVAAAQLESEGFRAHSAARRDSANLKWHLEYAPRGRIAVVLNHFDQPRAQDPLGLTRAQAQLDPRQATSVALQFDTRKTVRQQQAGLTVEQGMGDAQTLRLAAHRGTREVRQFLALPVAAQANPLSAGGVVDLDGDFDGADLRWSWQGTLGSGASEVVLGLEHERQRQQRRGYENFVGSSLGVLGALRRDERNDLAQQARYAQWWWRFAPRWTLLAGVRRSEVAFRAEDFYVRPGNPDDSGRVAHARSTPVAGLSFAPHADVRLYASYGRGFETPTFNELGYRADGGAGLAFDLRPATSDHVELGAKWRNASGAALQLAAFQVDTDDELAVARNVGGRASFRNVGRTRRAGVELGAQLPLSAQWSASLAYTRLDAEFRDAFALCSGAGCTTPNVAVAAGTRLPGTARDQLHATLAWQGAAWRVGTGVTALGPVTVNDAGSESAPGYALLHFEASRTWALAGGELQAFARLDNALDQRHIGSVIVNEGNGRFYEPGPGRGLWLGFQWHWQR